MSNLISKPMSIATQVYTHAGYIHSRSLYTRLGAPRRHIREVGGSSCLLDLMFFLMSVLSVSVLCDPWSPRMNGKDSFSQTSL
jgi:hypothetical protein